MDPNSPKSIMGFEPLVTSLSEPVAGCGLATGPRVRRTPQARASLLSLLLKSANEPTSDDFVDDEYESHSCSDMECSEEELRDAAAKGYLCGHQTAVTPFATHPCPGLEHEFSNFNGQPVPTDTGLLDRQASDPVPIPTTTYCKDEKWNEERARLIYQRQVYRRQLEASSEARL